MRSDNQIVKESPAGRQADSCHYVGFRISNQTYALPLHQVERALRLVAVSRVPDAPPWVFGVIDYQGRIIPVVSMRQRFNHPARDPHPDDHLLILKACDRSVALMVDQVTEVLEVPAGRVKRPEDTMDHAGHLTGVIPQEDGLILVFNGEKLLLSEGESGGFHA